MLASSTDRHILSVGCRLRLAGVAIVCAMIAFSSPLCAQHFYFAQMTDIHFGGEDNTARAVKVVDDINRLPMKIECTVVTGDMGTRDGALDAKTIDAALSTFGKLTTPVHYVAGNHDILTGDKAAATQEAFVKHFGPLASKAEHNGVVFLMIYTEPLRKPTNVPGYDPLKWLEQALIDAGDRPVIIFTHAPDDEDFFEGKVQSSGWPKESRGKWEALIKSHNVKAVITGYFHRDELHWIGSVPEFVSAPVASYFDRQNTYRVYEYTDGKMGYRTIYVN